MDEWRMGLGTDQLALPEELSDELLLMPLVPPPRGEADNGTNGHIALPTQAALANLAPWAVAMQLPGFDT